MAPTTPGIFTATGSGSGDAAILNQDGTLNSPTNPSARGDVVVVYMTGAGQTTPAGVSGRITTTSVTPPITPVPQAPVEVFIGGQRASILYSGLAPGLISGVMQLNVQIPTSASPGRVPIQVLIGGRSSQSGVTLSVR